MTLTPYILIGIGGALGAIARSNLSSTLPASLLGIPLPILCINILGCFAIGLLAPLLPTDWSASPHLRHFLISGLLGGFTTFSAFALEFGTLYTKQQYIAATIYIALSVGVSIAAFFIGMKCARMFV